MAVEWSAHYVPAGSPFHLSTTLNMYIDPFVFWVIIFRIGWGMSDNRPRR